MLLTDFEKSGEMNHFSRESKDQTTEMSNNEMFEVYETSLKSSDRAFYWEIGIVYCTCG